MSTEAVNVALGLVVISGPMTIIAVAGALLAIGWLREPNDQPPEFRAIASYVRLFVSPHATLRRPDRLAVVSAAVFWGLANLPLLAILASILFFRSLRGLSVDALAVIIVYFIAQGLWLVRIRQAVLRSRTGRGDNSTMP